MIFRAGKPAAVQLWMAACAFASGWVELWQASLNGALGPGFGDAVGCEWCGGWGGARRRTSPDVVIHQEDPVEDAAKGRDIAHLVAVGVHEGPDLSSSGDVGLAWQAGSQEFDKCEKVGGIDWRESVSWCAAFTWVFPVTNGRRR